MYKFYLDGMLFPVTPGSIDVSCDGDNQTYTLLDGGEINVLRDRRLKEFEFTALLPNQSYPFALSSNRASYYLNQLESMVGYDVNFVITRSLDNGEHLTGTSMRVSLENYSIMEDADKYGTDVAVKVSLKEYRDYGTKTVTIVEDKATVTETRQDDTTPEPKEASQTYTVKKGDCLWKIAKQFYGDGSKYTKIFNANKDLIKNADLIEIGWVLTIPT